MNASTSTKVSEEVIVRTTLPPHDHIEYFWLLLALLALAVVAAGLRRVFLINDPDQERKGYDTKRKS
jgi:hypothetical protein